MQTAVGRRWMESAAGRRCSRSFLDLRSGMEEVAVELYRFLDPLDRNIIGRLVQREQQEQQEQHKPSVRRELITRIWVTERALRDAAAQLVRGEMAGLEEQRRKVESSMTDTQVMWIFFESVFDSILEKLKQLHGILLASVLDSNKHPSISELFRETEYKLTRIKLETRLKLDKTEEAAPRITMETAEGSQGELISIEAGEEGAACIDKAAAELEQASEMGEESTTCIEKAQELENAAAKGMMMEEKMQTDQFLDIYSSTFLHKLSYLFYRPRQDTTSLSPMHFTHTTPTGDAAPSVATTLQIFSVKLQEINEQALESSWPLSVYGTVAARDAVDGNLNVLFHRARHNCQLLTLKDPCLQLTGPSRSIVATGPVDFEIELKVKVSRRRASEDRVLMRQTFVYSGGNNETTTTLLGNDNCCKIMLRCAKLENTVQATVVSVRVINWRKRAWPFKHGGKVSCVAKGPLVKPEVEEEVVLQDRLNGTGDSHDGYLHLSRHAVSVELNGVLRVIIRSSKFSGHVFFPAQECKSSQRTCRLGPYQVEVTVAWSLLIRDKRCTFISREECVDDGQAFRRIRRRRKTPLLETRSAKEIYSLLDLISKNAMKLKTEPKLRISDFSISEVKIHMDHLYRNVTSLLRMMERVHNNRGQEPVTEKMGVKTRTQDKGEAAKEPRTYYECGSNAIFNRLDELCTQLDQMGLLSYKGKSQLFSDLSRGVEAAKGKNKVSIEEAKEMGGEEDDSDASMSEEVYFESYRQSWVYNWSIFCGTFTETTSLSPMHFTHSTPGHSPLGASVDSTLQIYSIKVIQNEDDAKWPLQVYGVVAARDTVDRNRNILFSRHRKNCQELTRKDPFLRLTGPSRAIVTGEPAYVEIELKVKGATKSEDSVLMSHFWYYSSSSYYGLRTLYTPLEGDYCTMVLSAEAIGDSVQATIVGIHVRVPEGRPSPFEHGGRVVCSSLPRRKGSLPDSEHIAADPSFRQVVLQDGEMTTCSKGYLNLSRHVVSVKSGGKLEVVIEAKSLSGATACQVVASIEAQECNISEDVCHLGDSELKITVAWSHLVESKSSVSML